MHEHVHSIAPGAFHSGGEAAGTEDLRRRTLEILPAVGVDSLVDLNGRRDVADRTDRTALPRLSRALGVHVVAGFALYKDPWLAAALEASDRQLVGRFIESFDPGIDGIRAGIFGEVGTSLDHITPAEERQLAAAARAQAETGVAISTHCTLGTMALEQTEVLGSNGADLSRVVIGHLDLRPDVDHLTRVLEAGVNIAFDTFGKEWFDYLVPDRVGPAGEQVKHTIHRPDRDRISALAELCRRGYDDRIVLSCDMSGAEAWLNPSTHGRHGYAYLPRVVIPALTDAGVSTESIDRMLTDTPRRILTIP